jgi:hypothetical protein
MAAPINMIAKNRSDLRRIIDWEQVHNVSLLNYVGFQAGSTGNSYISEANFLTYANASLGFRIAG